jgi:ferric-dicitrate binding protein FerR (iron transport regulator)
MDFLREGHSFADAKQGRQEKKTQNQPKRHEHALVQTNSKHLCAKEEMCREPRQQRLKTNSRSIRRCSSRHVTFLSTLVLAVVTLLGARATAQSLAALGAQKTKPPRVGGLFR